MPVCPRFFLDRALDFGLLSVAGPEAHHMAGVHRVRLNDQVCLFNGDGREYEAVVRGVNRREVVLEIVAALRPARELGVPLEIAAPLPKGDRTQFLVEKLTELGATRLVPLRTARSIIVPGEARLDKLRRYVVEASKQCGRNSLMAVEKVTDWSTYCATERPLSLRVVAHAPIVGNATPVQLTQCCRSSNLVHGVHAAVGPEGGFTDAEIESALACGWRLVELGRRTLRIETAALVLAAWASLSLPTAAGEL